MVTSIQMETSIQKPNCLQQLSNCWDNRLDHILQYLEPSDLIGMAFVQKSCLKNVQFFFKHIKKNCTTKVAVTLKNLADGPSFCSIPDSVINHCLILLTKVTHFPFQAQTVYKPIKKYNKCHGFVLYGWIIEGRDMLLTGGKRRPYPNSISLTTDHYNGYTNSPIIRIIPYKVF